jgi:hypothetical protein
MMRPDHRHGAVRLLLRNLRFLSRSFRRDDLLIRLLLSQTLWAGTPETVLFTQRLSPLRPRQGKVDVGDAQFLAGLNRSSRQYSEPVGPTDSRRIRWGKVAWQGRGVWRSEGFEQVPDLIGSVRILLVRLTWRLGSQEWLR